MPFLPPVAVYVDPGSGSMMLQLLLGGVSGIYVIFRMFKQKIFSLFSIRTPEADPVHDAHPIVSKDDSLRRQA